jgi:Helix-turn-helix domain
VAETVRKTFEEKLRPTPAQERELEHVLWRRRDLYNTALEQRITAWQRCPVSVSRFEQEAELQAIRAAFPDYAAIHSSIRMSFKTCWCGSTRPIKRSSAVSSAEREERRRGSRASRGATAIAAIATLADGTLIHNPRCYRTAEGYLAKCQPRVSNAYPSARRAAIADGRRSAGWRRRTRQQTANANTSTTRRPWRSSETTTRSITKTCRSPTWCRITTSPSASQMPGGEGSSPSSLSKLQTQGSRSSRLILRSRARMLWLRRDRRQRLVRPLARVPGLRHQPASGPQRREEYRMVRAAPSETHDDARGDAPRSTEKHREPVGL